MHFQIIACKRCLEIDINVSVDSARYTAVDEYKFMLVQINILALLSNVTLTI
jgi:hypothetical protein